MTLQQDSAPEPKTLGQMLAENLGAALRGEITAEQAQANADAFREDSAPDGEGIGSFPQEAEIPTEQAGKPVVSGRTPGPWQVLDVGRACPVFEVRDSTGALVADLRPSAFYGDPDHANARLIAAAPELLEALTDVLNHSGVRGSYHAVKYGDAVVKAEAVIAKALPQQAAVLGSSLREEER